MYFVLIPKIVLKDTKLVDKSTGEVVKEQTVLISHGELMAPVQDSVLLGRGRKPFEIGKYEVLPESLHAGKYGRAEFRLQIGKKVG